MKQGNGHNNDIHCNANFCHWLSLITCILYISRVIEDGVFQGLASVYSVDGS